MKTADEFWACVQKTDGCWLWTMYRNENGYGRLNFNGTWWYAHRLAWVLTNGPIPRGKELLHECDNPACCRPHSEHVFLGTHAKNMADASARGMLGTQANGRWNSEVGEMHWTHRHPEKRLRGEANPYSKLTEEQVSQIRILYALGSISQRDLARNYGVTQRTIGRIVRAELWKHSAGFQFKGITFEHYDGPVKPPENLDGLLAAHRKIAGAGR